MLNKNNSLNFATYNQPYFLRLPMNEKIALSYSQIQMLET